MLKMALVMALALPVWTGHVPYDILSSNILAKMNVKDVRQTTLDHHTVLGC